MPHISASFINAGKRKGKLTCGQKRLLTGSWSPASGWEQRVIGNFITDETARLFLRSFDNLPRRTKPSAQKPDRYDIMRRFGTRSIKGACG